LIVRSCTIRLTQQLVSAWILLSAPAAVALAICEFPKELRVIRIDEHGQRIFLEANESTVSNLPKIKSIIDRLDQIVERCEPSWKSQWSASFFSDAKLAGYKTDGKIQGAVANGDWGRAYVAEYDRKRETLTTHPLDPKRLKTTRVGRRTNSQEQ
jgi:hypothetical protein